MLLAYSAPTFWPAAGPTTRISVFPLTEDLTLALLSLFQWLRARGI
jgi:hypothetical protein